MGNETNSPNIRKFALLSTSTIIGSSLAVFIATLGYSSGADKIVIDSLPNLLEFFTTMSSHGDLAKASFAAAATLAGGSAVITMTAKKIFDNNKATINSVLEVSANSLAELMSIGKQKSLMLNIRQNGINEKNVNQIKKFIAELFENTRFVNTFTKANIKKTFEKLRDRQHIELEGSIEMISEAFKIFDNKQLEFQAIDEAISHIMDQEDNMLYEVEVEHTMAKYRQAKEDIMQELYTILQAKMQLKPHEVDALFALKEFIDQSSKNPQLEDYLTENVMVTK